MLIGQANLTIADAAEKLSDLGSVSVVPPRMDRCTPRELEGDFDDEVAGKTDARRIETDPLRKVKEDDGEGDGHPLLRSITSLRYAFRGS